MHARNILVSFRSGLQPAIEDGFQSANLVHSVCVADFGQSCDAHGDKPLERRSLGMGELTITPPECYFASRDLVTKEVTYDSAVDVWAIGVNLFMMLAGYQSMVDFSRSEKYLRFWTHLIGKVPSTVAARMGWTLGQWALRPGTEPVCVRRVQPVARGSQGALSHPANVISMCELHLKILIYDPTQRPLAERVARLCDELSDAYIRHAASARGALATSSN